MGWVERERGLREGRENILRAVALDDCDPWGQIALGYSSMMERQTEESLTAFRRAVNLNPNSAAAHSYLSHGLAFAGQDRDAIEKADEAIRLSPLDPEMALFLRRQSSRSLHCRSIRRLTQMVERSVTVAAGFSGCAAHALREPCPSWAR
jgi:tetratricopeptide (TPR) repeat protein